MGSTVHKDFLKKSLRDCSSLLSILKIQIILTQYSDYTDTEQVMVIKNYYLLFPLQLP